MINLKRTIKIRRLKRRIRNLRFRQDCYFELMNEADNAIQKKYCREQYMSIDYEIGEIRERLNKI